MKLETPYPSDFSNNTPLLHLQLNVKRHNEPDMSHNPSYSTISALAAARSR